MLNPKYGLGRTFGFGLGSAWLGLAGGSLIEGALAQEKNRFSRFDHLGISLSGNGLEIEYKNG